MKILILALLMSGSAIGVELYTDGIIKEDLGLKPDQLVSEYVQRDAGGEFLASSKWWNKAVACPDCMGGPDGFTVISKYKIRKMGDLKFEVTYEIEGSVSDQVFTIGKKTKRQLFSIVKTPWGFKLDSKSYQMVQVNTALEKYGRILDESSRNFLKAIQAKPEGK